MKPAPPSDAQRVLVFAHTPPPHHGQSAMVQLMLDLLRDPDPLAGTARDSQASSPARLEVFHVNARLSRDMSDVGGARAGKLFTLLKHCLHALWLRYRRSIRILYYVPTPPSRTPLRRDWVVMALCRPFFARTVFHWHAAGLGEWLETQAHPWERHLSRLLLGKPHLSMVLRRFHRRDADYLQSRKIVVVPNGLPDPCPDFSEAVLPQRLQRIKSRQAALNAPSGGPPLVFRVLFLSMCRREKGIFDALEGLALANATLRDAPLRMELVVAGEFASAGEQAEFERRVQAPDLGGDPPAVRYVGFASGATKDRLLRESDCLCFPTYYPPEGSPLVLAEAMAYGLPVVTTDWRDLGEMLPPGYSGIVPIRSPAQIATHLINAAGNEYDPALRRWFLEHYTADRFAERLRRALSEL